MNTMAGYVFINEALLSTALTHKSFTNEKSSSKRPPHNEKLEFLGDAVLELVLTEALMETFPEASEGPLSKWRSQLVNEDILSRISTEINLANHLKLGKGELNTGGDTKPRILACAFEALLGAIFVDGGFSAAREIIREVFRKELLFLREGNSLDRDFKSQLQEKAQSEHKVAPVYVVIEQSGPAHDITFRVQCQINGKVISESQGKTKKAAEQASAELALKALSEGESK